MGDDRAQRRLCVSLNSHGAQRAAPSGRPIKGEIIFRIMTLLKACPACVVSRWGRFPRKHVEVLRADLDDRVYKRDGGPRGTSAMCFAYREERSRNISFLDTFVHCN